jgi:hypothetical protein
MGPDPTSYDLLAHFDRPKTVDSPDFEWVDEVIPDEQPAILRRQIVPPEPSNETLAARRVEAPVGTQRGVQWVLQWAAALAVLAFAGSTLVEFAYLSVAEHKLSIAARAGVLEATLPRASYQSVALVVESHLTQYPRLARRLQLTLVQNGSPVARQIRPGDGDRLSIALSAPSSAVLPDWLRIIMFWRGESPIQAHAERQLPGRTLSHN